MTFQKKELEDKLAQIEAERTAEKEGLSKRITKTEERMNADPKTFNGTRSKCEKGQQPVGDVAPVWIPKDRVSACQVTNLSSYDFDVAALPHVLWDQTEATPLPGLRESCLQRGLEQRGSPQTPQG